MGDPGVKCEASQAASLSLSSWFAGTLWTLFHFVFPTASEVGALLILELKDWGAERSSAPGKITQLEVVALELESCLASTSGSSHQSPGAEGWREWAEEDSGVDACEPN